MLDTLPDHMVADYRMAVAAKRYKPDTDVVPDHTDQVAMIAVAIAGLEECNTLVAEFQRQQLC
jgi:hypothetical protein